MLGALKLESPASTSTPSSLLPAPGRPQTCHSYGTFQTPSPPSPHALPAPSIPQTLLDIILIACRIFIGATFALGGLIASVVSLVWRRPPPPPRRAVSRILVPRTRGSSSPADATRPRSKAGGTSAGRSGATATTGGFRPRPRRSSVPPHTSVHLRNLSELERVSEEECEFCESPDEDAGDYHDDDDDDDDDGVRREGGEGWSSETTCSEAEMIEEGQGVTVVVAGADEGSPRAGSSYEYARERTDAKESRRTPLPPPNPLVRSLSEEEGSGYASSSTSDTSTRRTRGPRRFLPAFLRRTPSSGSTSSTTSSPPGTPELVHDGWDHLPGKEPSFFVVGRRPRRA